MKNIGVFYLKIFSVLEMKFSIYWNRRVFLMKKKKSSFGTMHSAEMTESLLLEA